MKHANLENDVYSVLNKHFNGFFTFEYGMTKNNSESLRKSVDQIYLSSEL